MIQQLDIDIRHRIGALNLHAKLVADKPVTAIFGRSGAGKTSLLNLIAGLLRPDAGRISFGGVVLADTGRRQFVPAHRRRFGYVFQDARLFPHLTVRGNLMYGASFAGGPTEGASVDRVVELLGLNALLGRWPHALSGGERQRVAIGRALLAQPKLLLMDEPLASLDGERKDEILSYIERVKTAALLPIVYVSHSVQEVLRLADAVAVMEEGHVQAIGPADRMMARMGPQTGHWRAEPSVVLDTVVVATDGRFGMVRVRTAIGTLDVPHPDAAVNARVRIRIGAGDVMLALTRPAQMSALDVVAGTVTDITPASEAGRAMCDVCVDVQGTTLVARVTAKACNTLALARGSACYAIIRDISVAP